MSVTHQVEIPVVPYFYSAGLVLMPRDTRGFFAIGPLRQEFKGVAAPLPEEWQVAIQMMRSAVATAEDVVEFPEFMRYLSDGTPNFRAMLGEYFNARLVMQTLLLVTTLEGHPVSTVRIERTTGVGVTGPVEVLRITTERAFGCVAQVRYDQEQDEAGTPWPAPPGST